MVRQLLIAFPRKGPPGPRRVASRDASQACWPLPSRPCAPHGSGLLQGRARTARRRPVFPVYAAGPLGKSGDPCPRGPHVRGRLLSPSRPCPPPRAAFPGASQFREWQDHRAAPLGHGELKGSEGKRPGWGRGLPLASKRRPSGLEVQTGVGRGPSRPQLPSGWWRGDWGVWLQLPARGHLLLGVGD